MWDRIEHRIALLELLASGRLPRRERQLDAWRWLSGTGWTLPGARRDELILRDEHRVRLENVLDLRWPEWRVEHARLEEHRLPPTSRGWERLQDISRAARVGVLPPQLSRRTASALVSPHSKAGLTRDRLEALPAVEITSDGSVRLRPPLGIVLRRGGMALDCDEIVAVLGEVAIPERALRDGLQLSGPMEAVLLVENLGAFQDIRPPDGWLVAHVPGWDTVTAVLLLERIPHVPVVHFGDLDPNGMRIVQHIRAARSDLRWFVPDFWVEWVPGRAQAGAWPDGLDLQNAPPLVQRLAREGLWLEQEGIVLDDRLAPALAELVREV